MTTQINKKAMLAALAVLASSSAFAVNADYHVYWTRGFDGTNSLEATTTNKVFSEDGGAAFSDRFVATGKNTISEIDALATPILDSTTGRAQKQVLQLLPRQRGMYIYTSVMPIQDIQEPAQPFRTLF